MRIQLSRLSESVSRYNEWNSNSGLPADKASAENQPVRGDLAPLRADLTEQEFATAAMTNDSAAIDDKRRNMLKAVSKEPLDFAFDRAIGKNDAVYSNFIELILDAKRKTGRIVIKDGGKESGYATGFMVSENLLLTNWHVFREMKDVADSEVQFFYEYDLNGTPTQPIAFRLNTTVFYHSCEELDYCFVGVEQTDLTQTHSLSAIGYIFLDPAMGKLGNINEEALNIIHHPGGDFKQLSIRENLLVQKLPKTIWYKTDTAQGSSGSPVFNDQWQVVALHHMGIPKRDGDAFVDREGKLFYADEDGQVDSSRIIWEANEGIRISAILEDLFSSLPDSGIIRELRNEPKPMSGAILNRLSSDTIKNDTPMNSDNINISLPASLLDANGTITVSISNQTAAQAPKSLPEKPEPAAIPVSEEPDELKKIEEETDYSLCKGYQPGFLGTSVAIPKPKKELKKYISTMLNSTSNVVHYHHYSLLFHSVRMMPAISVINVDGDPAKRRDNSPRKDTWIKDKRLDPDIQLGDNFYKNSGFDRGHMSRREDANWGNTPEDALLHANLTCVYTNACPQVAGINQSSRKGLWGKLEQVVLENGAQKEKGKWGKISVFNGPIFEDDDPVFRGVQVPLSFFKVILWLDDNSKLKATAFRLSQEKLVGDIDFQEAINIDQNREFREYQLSIKKLEEMTGLDLSHISDHDTFTGHHDDAHELTTIEALRTHFSDN